MITQHYLLGKQPAPTSPILAGDPITTDLLGKAASFTSFLMAAKGFIHGLEHKQKSPSVISLTRKDNPTANGCV